MGEIVTFSCQHCGQSFTATVYPSDKYEPTFCSRECMQAHRDPGPREYICQQCGRTFRPVNPSGTHPPKYCSRECVGLSQRSTKSRRNQGSGTCPVCGEPVGRGKVYCGWGCFQMARKAGKLRVRKPSGTQTTTTTASKRRICRTVVDVTTAASKPTIVRPSVVRPPSETGPWALAGHRLCTTGGAHHSECVQTTREGWVYRCIVCGAEAVFPMFEGPFTNHTIKRERMGRVYCEGVGAR